MPDQKKYHRRSIRLKDHDYSQPGTYFVTLCTWSRKCLFGEIMNDVMKLNEMGQMVQSNWGGLSNRFASIEIDEFVIMPNHLHGILVISDTRGAIHESPLPHVNKAQRRNMLVPKIMGYFKMNTSKEINEWRNTLGIPVWQRNYHDHIIRNERSLTAIRQYIQNNPARWPHDSDNPANVGAIDDLAIQDVE